MLRSSWARDLAGLFSVCLVVGGALALLFWRRAKGFLGRRSRAKQSEVSRLTDARNRSIMKPQDSRAVVEKGRAKRRDRHRETEREREIASPKLAVGKRSKD